MSTGGPTGGNGGSITATGAITLTPGTGGTGAVQVKPPTGDAFVVYQSDGVSPGIRYTDSGAGGVGQLIFYGHTGSGKFSQVGAIGLDSTKAGAAGQDFTLFTRINADGSDSDADGLYTTIPAVADAAHPSSWAFGLSGPPTTYRGWFVPGAGDLTQGGVIIMANASQTGSPFVVLAGIDSVNSDAALRVDADFGTRLKANPSNRVVADGVTNSTTTVTSATAAFTALDKGRYITGAGIPSGSYIASVTNATTVVISQAATATASSVALTIVVPHFSSRTWSDSPLFQAHIGSGGGAFSVATLMGVGPGAPATPTSTLDVVQAGATAGSFKVRNSATGNCVQILALGSGATTTLGTTGGSTLAIGTNGPTQAIFITTTQSVLIGKVSIATNATDGFPYIPAAAGAPTGVPTAQTGFAPMYYDTTNHKLWVYDGGWKGVVVA